ncbi:hypothetical protein ACFS5N_17530 [Mucilaginibacter ximonensis]|uniref:YtxH-like protein n=1 Tax=Mucilaginibacter ximonensis TaxID=538021 RepID=A0ABW5YG29_9SPHI
MKKQLKKEILKHNPFKKHHNNTALIALGVAGAAAAGAIAYFYFTDNGNDARNKAADSLSEAIDKLSHNIKDEFKSLVSAFISDKTGVAKHTVKAVADHVSE